MTENWFSAGFRRVWFIFIPTTLLLLLGIYSLLPGNLLTLERSSIQIIAEQLKEKKLLEIEFEALSNRLNGPVCTGDQVLDQTTDLLPSPLQSDRKTAVSKLDKAVVLLIVQFKDTDDIAFGSGFFITQNLIATNGHVVSGSDEQDVESIFAINKFFGIKEVSIKNIDYDQKAEKDFAILEVDEDVGVPLKFATTNGDDQFRLLEVIAAGFPGSVIESDERFINLMNLEKFEVPELVITSGSINSKQNVFGEINAFVHTAQISQGNSGGPLVNNCGEVLGINTFLVTREDDVRNFSITAGELQKFLRKSGVNPLVAVRKCE